MSKLRLDLFLYKNGYVKSRNVASELIKTNNVLVNGNIINSANFLVDNNDVISLESNLKWVSRAGYKLEYALNEFKIDLSNKTILDVGASTGGFCDVCLANNASKVFALDVGTDQLDLKIKNNPKIIDMSNTNIKTLSTIDFGCNIDLIVCDLSFISLKFLFEQLSLLTNKINELIVLIKPQFELDQKIISKNKGFVKNESDRLKAIDKVLLYASDAKYQLNHKIIKSPILGAKKNNVEYLAHFKLKI